ncbi:MAG TPA: hypothetical protein VKN14_00250, partial [Flavobacteriaceae bacterium]|nr:hypothetical protein [Flavobacteriaceae bacterium]
MKKIIVLGDSHVRSFAKHTAFMPLFMGPGKEICFIDESKYNNTLHIAKKVLANFNKDDHFVLVFGEPDCRWCAGQGWHPWNSKNKAKANMNKLEKSSLRYIKFLFEIKKEYKNIYIYNVT